MRRQNGVALVLVLWVITLLAVIAGNFAFSMRSEAQIARNLLINSQLNKLATDLKNNSPDLELLEKFTGHEKQEIARLLDAAAAQQTNIT